MKTLAARYALDEHQRAQLTTVLDELVRDPHAPTAVRAPEQAADVHLADSLVALALDSVRAAATLADIGSGAGFPGLPLAIALPRCDVSLVESHTRKCAFLERVCARAQLANARVVCARAEEWLAGSEQNEVVVARALAPPAVVLEYAAPLLQMGGTLVDWRGRRAHDDDAAAAFAAAQLGLRLVEIRRVEPYARVRDHHLHVYVKERPTPARFPRRPGAARKRPLAPLRHRASLACL